MPATFLDFFRNATGNTPYDYQSRLGGGDAGRRCESQLISIPTGLGKTAAVVLAWLWNRVHVKREDWPRRLVICLPMRTLVEQTCGEAEKWVGKLAAQFPGNADLQWLAQHSPILLMGGEEAGEWDIFPEKPAILIGTQDMLLSRALNRGYGMARARWPMHFGLLNNDTLWVLDETQLMGVGVRTSAQLEGLRETLGVAAGCATWWASATLDSRLLDTPDHRTLPVTLALSPKDLSDAEVDRRIASIKRLSALPLSLSADTAKAVDPFLEKLAAAVIEKHQAGTTIVILNRVNRARDLFDLLGKLAKKHSLPEGILVHSRFRPMERVRLSKQLKEPGEKIIVATQAIEAGVDISARTLITELAPWSSLVQRFGRCNRKGEFNDTGGADIFWIDLAAENESAAAGLSLPYTPEQLATARSLLQQAEPNGASPAAIEKISAVEPLPETHILRRKDLVDLFDTTPDLAGLDIDVGRYIRDDEDRDVQAFWRALSKDISIQDLELIAAQRAELVRVPLHEFRKFVDRNKTERRIWHWNPLEGEWQVTRTDRIAPGQVFLVDQTLGGYSATLGWTGEKSKEPLPVLGLDDQPKRKSPRDGQSSDEESQFTENDAKAWQSIEQHTAHVLAACNEKIAALSVSQLWADALRTAARWHDVGKAHSCFQAFITASRDIPAELAQSFIAKAPWKAGSKHRRPHFRHELASALAWLQAGKCDDEASRNLIAYLIATHHGKIRLSIRAMPGEKAPDAVADGASPLFARGVWHGEKLPEDQTHHLAIDGFPPDGLTLDLSCMQMGEQQNGQPSWTSRALALRDSSQLGLFRLAWLESILRAADAEGSQQ